MKGNFRLQGECGRAAWSEAQPPPRVGVRVRFVSKREPDATIRMGLGSAGCRKILVAFTVVFLFYCLASWSEAQHTASVRVSINFGRKREPRAPAAGGLESSC